MHKIARTVKLNFPRMDQIFKASFIPTQRKLLCWKFPHCYLTLPDKSCQLALGAGRPFLRKDTANAHKITFMFWLPNSADYFRFFCAFLVIAVQSHVSLSLLQAQCSGCCVPSCFLASELQAMPRSHPFQFQRAAGAKWKSCCQWKSCQLKCWRKCLSFCHTRTGSLWCQ